MKKSQNINNNILIKGARVHNLKNIDLEIPRDKLIVITGLSGSGKSSLAFDTLYAEGQRKYVESLSSYARQFLGRMSKPDVDDILGIPPAIAIEQRVVSGSSRSTVGTSTEIYDYIKLLFARVGKTISPVSGKEVKKDTVSDVVDYLNSFEDGTKAIIYSPVNIDSSLQETISKIQTKGFSRVRVDGEVFRIDKLEVDKKKKVSSIDIIVDRIVINKSEEENVFRITDSVETAFYESHGDCVVEVFGEDVITKAFSNRFELDGMKFEEPSVHLFTFNNPFGACKTCEGFGSTIGIDEDLVIPDRRLSVYEGAVACWKGDKMIEWKNDFIRTVDPDKFPIHRPYKDLTDKEKDVLWKGGRGLYGIDAFFKFVEKNKYKIQYRVLLSRYSGRTTCPDCRGTRIRKDANYVKIDGKSITDLVLMPISKLYDFFKEIKFTDYELNVSKMLIEEITFRIQMLNDVGLGYLTLNRNSNTLSGGESQRMRLSSSLGSGLVGSIYILDEPSIGLHSRDTERLIKVITKLRDMGNTVVIVEHDEEIIRTADQVIDIGPFAGAFGGEVVFQGTLKQLLKDNGLTAKYLSGEEKIEVPTQRRKWNEYVLIKGANQNNLKYIDVKFPLRVLTVVTGVSGSGKSTLVNDVMYSVLKRNMGEGFGLKIPKYEGLEGDYKTIHKLEYVDQNPIGKSSRSNPVTYTKAYDDIRNLFAKQKISTLRGYKPSFFSFNVAGGRCEECEGDGVIRVEMQFMADVELVCESCGGKRFKEEVLEVMYRGKNIYDVLDLTVDEALAFFAEEGKDKNKNILNKLQPLADVGLGYLKLGQASSTLSGGEAQRIKLALFLQKGVTKKHTLFIFDEPTTGLHFYDINKLMIAFNSLIERGHSVIVIEHNIDVIKSADWLIDLGPEGGDEGGNVVFEGIPEDLVKCKESYTGGFLKGKL